MNLLEALHVIESYGLQIVSPKKKRTKRGMREKMVAEAMGTTYSSGSVEILKFDTSKVKKKRKRKNYLITDADVRTIKKLRKKGLSVAKIAKRIGCSESTVYGY